MPKKKGKNKITCEKLSKRVSKKKVSKRKRPGKMPVRFTAERRARFLELVREHGVLAYASEQVGISQNLCWMHRKKDPEFNKQVEEALDVAVSKLELEARRRAVEGVREPVYQGGALVGYKLVHSDRLLEKLLEAHLPRKYSDRLRLVGDDDEPAVSITFAPAVDPRKAKSSDDTQGK